MMEDIFETVKEGSNVVYLDMPKKDFLFKYNNFNRDSAQNLVDNYFKEKGRDGIPKVEEISLDDSRGIMKITVAVNYERDFKLEEYKIPDSLNEARK
ncbi:hypothetical protein [Clostridium pasteurianum]|uniref:Uncharacterized protein n=1 Tax=Clostridium pasteurianum BC1 TaxID=86416 RepID=R4K971_CLOPA|nr:hypothetical protein [Clostridium pasteurianum]AGK97059.1 hypothetical protein Clopa_2182 [Clostridium pasteurianum BC1]